ncbi:hypothetical protein V497_00256 [Pseudogymnoascus sp. VKM F-4516 (FW-969)]|nr:hypothetical protein V497_00256 [Pseudogymnoascus sp. VKM F-4516 (FW-969)]
MDRASQALAQGVPPGVPDSYRALADHGNVPRSTLNYRARGRRSIEEKAQSQQYLKPWEEDVVVNITRQRPEADRLLQEQRSAGHHPVIHLNFLLQSATTHSQLGLAILPIDVKLITKPEDLYQWSISTAGKAALFNRQLSKHSTGAYIDLCNGVGVHFKAVPGEGAADYGQETRVVTAFDVPEKGREHFSCAREDAKEWHERFNAEVAKREALEIEMIGIKVENSELLADINALREAEVTRTDIKALREAEVTRTKEAREFLQITSRILQERALKASEDSQKITQAATCLKLGSNPLIRVEINEISPSFALVGDALIRLAILDTWFPSGASTGKEYLPRAGIVLARAEEGNNLVSDLASNNALNNVIEQDSLAKFVVKNPCQKDKLQRTTLASTTEAIVGAVCLPSQCYPLRWAEAIVPNRGSAPHHTAERKSRAPSHPAERKSQLLLIYKGLEWQRQGVLQLIGSITPGIFLDTLNCLDTA